MGLPNPEVTGMLISLFEPGVIPSKARTFSHTTQWIDARRKPGTGLEDVREFAYKHKLIRELDPEHANAASRELTIKLHNEGRLIGYRSANITGFGDEGASGGVFTTVIPDIGKSYMRTTGAPAVMGFRIPKEARIMWVPTADETTNTAKLFKTASAQGYHALQRGHRAHELILTPNFFIDFPHIKPEPVRFTGNAPVRNIFDYTPGQGQEGLGMRRSSPTEPTLAKEMIKAFFAKYDRPFAPKSVTDYISQKGEYLHSIILSSAGANKIIFRGYDDISTFKHNPTLTEFVLDAWKETDKVLPPVSPALATRWIDFKSPVNPLDQLGMSRSDFISSSALKERLSGEIVHDSNTRLRLLAGSQISAMIADSRKGNSYIPGSYSDRVFRIDRDEFLGASKSKISELEDIIYAAYSGLNKPGYTPSNALIRPVSFVALGRPVLGLDGVLHYAPTKVYMAVPRVLNPAKLDDFVYKDVTRDFHNALRSRLDARYGR